MTTADKILEVLDRLEKIGYRLTDRTVDPGDIEYINEQIQNLNKYLERGLETLIDDDKEQEILAMVLLAFGTLKPWLIYQKIREMRRG